MSRSGPKGGPANRYRLLAVALACALASEPLWASGLDTELLRKINRANSPWADDVVRIIETGPNLAYGLGPVIYLYGVIDRNDPARATGILISSTVLLNGVLTFGTKRLVNRKRPFEVLPDLRRLDNPTGPSFPSGHTSAAFALAGAVTFRSGNWRLAVPLYAWAFLAGYGRVYQGVHYPSDVVAGAVVGTGSAFLVHRLRSRIVGVLSKFATGLGMGLNSRLYLHSLTISPGQQVQLGVRMEF